jgi:hypothetical protein
MMNLESLKGNKTLVRNLMIGGVVALGLAGQVFKSPESTQRGGNQTQFSRMNDPRFDQSSNASEGWGEQMPQTDNSGYDAQGYSPQGFGAQGYSTQGYEGNGGSNISANSSIEQPYNQFNDPDYIKSQENRHQMERDILGGTSTFVDPNSGQQYQMDSSTSNAWADQNGNTVGSDTSATQPDSSFTALTPLETNTGTSTDTSATTTTDTTGQ